MPKYYVSEQQGSKDKHMVHREHCDELHASNNPISLSYHNDMQSAVEKARKLYPEAGKCDHCANQKYN